VLEAQNWADFSGLNASLALAGITNQTEVDAFGLFTGQVGSPPHFSSMKFFQSRARPTLQPV
jgi:hypothetical protein